VPIEVLHALVRDHLAGRIARIIDYGLPGKQQIEERVVREARRWPR
jgi:hypothetical protein